jgi:hypothetical protein
MSRLGRVKAANYGMGGAVSEPICRAEVPVTRGSQPDVASHRVAEYAQHQCRILEGILYIWCEPTEGKSDGGLEGEPAAGAVDRQRLDMAVRPFWPCEFPSLQLTGTEFHIRPRERGST